MSVRHLLAASAAAFALTSAPVQAELLSGDTGPVEEPTLIYIGMDSFFFEFEWSVNTSDRAYLYGRGNDIAVAPGVTTVEQIGDASLLDFTTTFVGPLCDAACAANGVGDFIVLRRDGAYGAFRIDDIIYNGGDPTLGTLSGTWWIQLDGTSQFAPAVPEPGSWAMLLGGIALIGAAVRRRAS